ncbi:hypothetical protein HNQ91_003503 [Filimonas zeae]|nr:hypothetical protein [Filimonas zeae]
MCPTHRDTRLNQSDSYPTQCAIRRGGSSVRLTHRDVWLTRSAARLVERDVWLNRSDSCTNRRDARLVERDSYPTLRDICTTRRDSCTILRNCQINGAEITAFFYNLAPVNHL